MLFKWLLYGWHLCNITYTEIPKPLFLCKWQLPMGMGGCQSPLLGARQLSKQVHDCPLAQPGGYGGMQDSQIQPGAHYILNEKRVFRGGDYLSSHGHGL